MSMDWAPGFPEGLEETKVSNQQNDKLMEAIEEMKEYFPYEQRLIKSGQFTDTWELSGPGMIRQMEYSAYEGPDIPITVKDLNYAYYYGLVAGRSTKNKTVQICVECGKPKGDDPVAGDCGCCGTETVGEGVYDSI